MQINTEIREIGPQEAAALLAMNTRNRPLDKRRAARMAEAIKRGEWALNGDTIRVSVSGVLLDGQHRLTAILMSGMSVPTLVVEGLPDEIFKSIDVDKTTRKASDILAIRGVKNYTTTSAIARLVFIYEASGNPFNGNPDLLPSAQQIDNLVDSRVEIQEAASRTSGRRWCMRALSPRIAGFCDVVFTAKDADRAADFFEKLECGAGLDKGSPILLLRERLIGSVSDKEEIKAAYKAALTFKAFRLHMDDAYVKTLRVRTTGDTAEKDLFKI